MLVEKAGQIVSYFTASFFGFHPQTPNAQIEYSLIDETGNQQDRFFGITDEGNVYKRLPTSGNGDPQTFTVRYIYVKM